MKWGFALAVLALFQPAATRGLKTPRGPEVQSKQLQADNEALKKQNKHLEAMMQVARAEVQRMDHMVGHSKKQGHDGGGVATDTQEVADLKQKLNSAEADKKALVQTLRKMLAKNSTEIFRAQATNAIKAKHALETKCNKDRDNFQAMIAEANEKCDETKEMAQTLQDQNMDLQRNMHDLKEKDAKSEKAEKDLLTDKGNLMETMHNLMRENNKAKKSLQTETEKEKKALQDRTVEEAKLAKLLEKPKPAKKVVKDGHMHLNHEESGASKLAKMKKINRYIDSANTPSDDALSLNAMQKEEDMLARAHSAAGSSDWGSVGKSMEVMEKQEGLLKEAKLAAAERIEREAVKSEAAAEIPKDANGLSPIDALDPEAVKEEADAAAKKAKADADDGGDGIENLLSQAKDQLSAMDTAEAQNIPKETIHDEVP